MAKSSRKNTSSSSSPTTKPTVAAATKVKRTRKSVPRDSPPQRSSIYRGVTRHRWTGRYEAHLWDKNCWNESQKKKGRQVYLGAYDDEETAAHAYDSAALKYWGQDTILNFPASNYEKEMKEMEHQTKEEYIGSLRRKSSGFSRGVSKYRGVARHHHNGRWEARIGRVFGNKYLYLGTYATQEEAATAYDMAAIEYRGLNAVTNFDLSRYIKSLRSSSSDHQETLTIDANPVLSSPDHDLRFSSMTQQQQSSSSSSCLKETTITTPPRSGGSPTSALGLLSQSSKFKQMREKTTTSEDDANSQSSSTPPPESDHQPRSIFPDHIQTYFDCGDSSSYAEADDIIFGGLNSFASPMFHCDLDG